MRKLELIFLDSKEEKMMKEVQIQICININKEMGPDLNKNKNKSKLSYMVTVILKHN
jgi:hypothetical protein